MGPGPEQATDAPHGDSAQDLPAQLPSGRHGLPRRFVVANQRKRILAAVAHVVADIGYPRATVGEIVTAARLSRRTFYEHFDGKEDCYLATYDAAVERGWQRVEAAQRGHEDWAGQVRASLAAVIDMLVQDPELGRACLVEVVAAGLEALDRRNHTMKRFAAGLNERGQRHVPPGVEVPPIAAELVVGGLYEIISARLIAGQPETLYDELPQMTYCVLVPYCGHREASAAAARMA